ncbi:discoidin domain-containing protein [Chitinophaga sp. G-6-1-13]|uniref:Discoidin domain-containing protein n=1 Tax=Chitinophaga fulva TaxID=2728842 RepID=A0A848GMQ0_9BACT|nr:discoidin domain-containing protein [Chitinophaga fulva]NML39706.1 discoidin domain-containing protein [Chitinophaga fulva]
MTKIFHYLVVTTVLMMAMTGCRKQSEPATLQKTDAKSSLGVANGVANGTYMLNVVYFVPSDLDTVPGYRARLNGVFLYMQNFTSKWMNQWGYTGKTLGLQTDSSGQLKISLIRGQLGKNSYPYDGGSGAVMTEVNAYFAAHPAEKKSDHIMVVIPTYSYGANGDPSGGPFYGIGRWCFALDYTGLDTINLGKPDDKFSTKWIGGMAHEMGHGINLPHNGGAQSQNILYGTTLMGYGNGTLGKAPTYFSPADAAILANGQLFSSVTRGDWYTDPGCQVKRVYAAYNSASASIIVSGKFSATKPVKDIAYYNRNTGNDNGGYNSVTFASKPIGTDSFRIVMPVSDFRDKGNTSYEFTIRLCHENGSITSYVAAYSFVNGTPVITFGDKVVYDKTGWTVAAFSSEETASENGAAANIIDGSGSSFWHSRWSSNATSYPHYITVDMGQALDVNRFTFKQRDSRMVKVVEILTSNNNSTWTSLGDFTLAQTTNPQNIVLSATQNFRYFKLNMKSSYDGQQFAAMCEVGTYKD